VLEKEEGRKKGIITQKRRKRGRKEVGREGGRDGEMGGKRSPQKRTRALSINALVSK
jgi:hypothetical protein